MGSRAKPMTTIENTKLTRTYLIQTTLTIEDTDDEPHPGPDLQVLIEGRLGVMMESVQWHLTSSKTKVKFTKSDWTLTSSKREPRE